MEENNKVSFHTEVNIITQFDANCDVEIPYYLKFGAWEEAEECITHKFYGKTAAASQRERRLQFLERQREKRCERADEHRNIQAIFNDAEFQTKKYKRSLDRLTYYRKLMYSEWLVDIPDDLAENWLIKVCPQGRRCLVVAHKGKTVCYWENGSSFLTLFTHLPGGGKLPYEEEANMFKFTILDCVYVQKLKTFLIFDCLAWNNLSMKPLEAQVRFFLLKSKMVDNPEIAVTQNNSPYGFVLVDHHPADPQTLQHLMNTPFLVKNHTVPYEGVVFYHKEGSYLFEHTPLVGWLLTFMLPELFNIRIRSQYCRRPPSKYVNAHEYIEYVTQKKKNKFLKKKPEHCDIEMQEESAEREMADVNPEHSDFELEAEYYME